VRYDAIVSISLSDKRLWIPVGAYCHHVDPVAISHLREPRQYFPPVGAEKRMLQAVFSTKCQCQKLKRKHSRYLTGQMTAAPTKFEAEWLTSEMYILGALDAP
jgi:hypothetical protein